MKALVTNPLRQDCNCNTYWSMELPAATRYIHRCCSPVNHALWGYKVLYADDLERSIVDAGKNFCMGVHPSPRKRIAWYVYAAELHLHSGRKATYIRSIKRTIISVWLPAGGYGTEYSI